MSDIVDAITDLIQEQVECSVDNTINASIEAYINDCSFVTNDEAWEIANDAASENCGGNETSIYELNEMLRQVSNGSDCSDGNPFRDAVSAIITTNMLKGGTAISDGSAMSIVATGDEREIQAILTRRREYFEDILIRIRQLYGASPADHTDPPTPHDEEALKSWTRQVSNKARMERDNYSADDDNGELVTIPKKEWDDIGQETTRLHRVADSAVSLVALLTSLHNGNSGRHALEHARAWSQVTTEITTMRRTPTHTDSENDGQ